MASRLPSNGTTTLIADQHVVDVKGDGRRGTDTTAHDYLEQVALSIPAPGRSLRSATSQVRYPLFSRPLRPHELERNSPSSHRILDGLVLEADISIPILGQFARSTELCNTPNNPGTIQIDANR